MRVDPLALRSQKTDQSRGSGELLQRRVERSEHVGEVQADAVKDGDDGQAVCPSKVRAADRALQAFSGFSGSLIGTCRDVLTTRVLPSCGLSLRSVSRTRKNFSESIFASPCDWFLRFVVGGPRPIRSLACDAALQPSR